MGIGKLLVWCALGYAGGWLAARKGYPPRLGVVAGVLGGPIALVVCLLLPRTKAGHALAKMERELAAETQEFGQRHKCPSCGREVSVRAPSCPRCDHRF